MARLVPTTLVLVVFLFAPQLDAAPSIAAFEEGLKRFNELTKEIYEIFMSKYERDSKATLPPKHGLQAPVKWSDGVGYVVELPMGGVPSDFSISTTISFMWTDKCGSFPPSGAPVPYPCDSQVCQFRQSECHANSRCQYQVPLMRGYLASSAFTFNDSAPYRLSIGCSDMNSTYDSDIRNSSVVGLGPGGLSLISQLNVSKFSYCFPDYADSSLSSQMFFGSYADLEVGTDVATTSLQTPANSYGINLTGMSIGELPVAINSTLVVVDSSRPATYLERSVYGALKRALRSYVVNASTGALPMKAPPAPFDLCFSNSSKASLRLMPSITFDFDGASMKLPITNYLLPVSDSAVCLTIMPTDANYSILGNYQQQNIQFIYDLQKGKLSFRNVKCDKLQPQAGNATGKESIGSNPSSSVLLVLLLLQFIFLLVSHLSQS